MGVLVLAAAAGLPHGALDQTVAARLLRPRFGVLWPAPFVVGYLGIAAIVLVAWAMAPAATLAGFLLASALHFGLGDAQAHGRLRWPAVLAHGGAPIIAPSLTHPDEIARVFGVLAGPDGDGVLSALTGPAALAWAGACVLVLLGAVRSPALRAPAAELAVVIAAFCLLPPLLAFALYFGGLHSVRALAGELEREGPLIGSKVVAGLRSGALPTFAALVATGLGFAWLLAASPPSVALMQAVFFGLSALTAPHMVLAVLARDRARLRP